MDYRREIALAMTSRTVGPERTTAQFTTVDAQSLILSFVCDLKRADLQAITLPLLAQSDAVIE